MREAKDFTLNNEQGHAVTLSHLLEEGPVWLFFYRGFW